jgi:hypothetical protein
MALFFLFHGTLLSSPPSATAHREPLLPKTSGSSALHTCTLISPTQFSQLIKQYPNNTFLLKIVTSPTAFRLVKTPFSPIPIHVPIFIFLSSCFYIRIKYTVIPHARASFWASVAERSINARACSFFPPSSFVCPTLPRLCLGLL